MDHIEKVGQQIARRKQILDQGVGWELLEEYNSLTMKIAEAAPSLLRALNDIITLRDELSRDESQVSAVAHAFAAEIDRALKGKR